MSKFAKIEAKLLDYFEPMTMIKATRTSHNSLDKMDSYWGYDMKFVFGENDEKLLKRVITLNETSVLEHIVFQYHLKFPRFVLQELSRHRIGISPTVKSTRYTLKELFKVKEEELSKFLYDSGDVRVNKFNLIILKNIRKIFKNYPNDKLKQMLPEAYMTEGIYTINGRALRHLFQLRLVKKAHPSFRELAQKMYDVTPYIDLIMYKEEDD